MTSTAPIPARPARPCTAELLAPAQLPATTAGTAVTSPKIPAYVGDDMPVTDSDHPASLAELLAAAGLPVTTAGPLATEPKLPPFRGD